MTIAKVAVYCASSRRVHADYFEAARRTGADFTAAMLAESVREANADDARDHVRIGLELPALGFESDVARLKADAPDLARRWQQSLRRAFTTYLNARHARVAGVHADTDAGRWFYAVDMTGGDS